MAKKLSTISFMPAVSGISRKFALRKETCTTKDLSRGNSELTIPGVAYMGASVRNVSVVGYGPVQKNVLFFRRPMAKPIPTAGQLEVRARFQQVNQWVRDAFEDLSAMQTNMTRWRDAKADLSKTISGVSARGYQSMSGWMKGVVTAYAAAHEGSTPSGHTLPAFDA